MTRRAVLVEETPVRLEVDGVRHAVWTATPESLEALAAGRLLADGFIRSTDDIMSIDIEESTEPRMISMRAQVRDGAAAHERRRHIQEHGCGVLGLVDCLKAIDRAPPHPPPLDTLFPAALLHELFAAESAMRGERGGMHAAGVSHRGLDVIAFDVSRHSAVDKAVGGALLQGVPLAKSGLVISARISGEIAAKAAVAGVWWLASRSIATTLAVRIARAGGVRLIGRAASPEWIDYP